MTPFELSKRMAVLIHPYIQVSEDPGVIARLRRDLLDVLDYRQELIVLAPPIERDLARLDAVVAALRDDWELRMADEVAKWYKADR